MHAPSHILLPSQADLAPLRKLLKDEQEKEQKRQEAAAHQLELQLLGQEGDTTSAAAAGDDGGGGGGVVSESKPMPMREMLTPAEQHYWERSDDIIMTVLRRWVRRGVQAGQS